MTTTPFTPLSLLQNARQEARDQRDLSSKYCTLASLEEGLIYQARMRTLVVREITEKGCLLFVNKTSPKKLDDLSRARVEALFFYPSVMAQFRMRGTLAWMDEAELASHWQHKPYESKLLDHYYSIEQKQSSVLASRAEFDQAMRKLKQTYPDAESVPFAESAAGLYIHANYLEVWQGRADSLHERSLYQLVEGEWRSEALVP